MSKIGVTTKKRIVFSLYVTFFLCLILIGRIGWHQFVRGEELQNQAIQQQTRDKIIASKRGTIYDRNMKPLAVSASVYTVIANPKVVKEEKAQKDVALYLSKILDKDYEEIYKIVTKDSGYEYVKRKIESEQSDKIKQLIAEEKLPGIELIEDTKRYYPYSNFAAHLIGFTGTDNYGLAGIELQYDKYLTGTSGKIVTATNAAGGDMPFNYEKYYGSKDGLNVVLTIDEVIQHIVENNLETAVVENDVKNGACAIVMDVKTGEILAMSTKPDFDLNQPFTLNDEEIAKALEELKEDDEKEYNKQLGIERNRMWRNKALVDTYEPGSTFKIITSAIALEENLVGNNDLFTCTGVKNVAGTDIRCWKTSGHGTQDFAKAIQNSCNPAFMDIGQRVGAGNFAKYVRDFNLITSTGIDLPGEATGIFFDESAMGVVEIATTSFGQGFQVTPIQLISAISAVANDGNYITPHVVKELTNSNGDVVEKFEGQLKKKVVSKETSEILCRYLEDAVTLGSGKNAYIQGYRIAGKTGTSEKQPRSANKKIASMVAFAPADDPQVAVLVMLDEPEGGQYYGGVIAAPVLGNIMNDVLGYLKVTKTLSSEDEEVTGKSVPQLVGKDITTAKKLVADNELNIQIIGDGNKVLSQTPKGGSKLQKGGMVIAYTTDVPPAEVTVPDVSGMTISGANQAIVNSGLNMKITGAGRGMGEEGSTVAAAQTPAPGETAHKGSIVYVEFRHLDVE